MVPGVDFVLRGRRTKRSTLIGVAVAFVGVYLLVDPRGGVRTGDLWTLLCAFLYALYMVGLDGALRRSPFEVVLYAQLVTAAVLGWIGAVVLEQPHLAATPRALRAILIVSFGATVGALYLQNRYQARTTPTRAALIFTAEPAFASVIAYFLLGEVLPARGFVGAALILAGILISEML
jgi:drug/metabolite transporter (DMT)-like permease